MTIRARLDARPDRLDLSDVHLTAARDQVLLNRRLMNLVRDVPIDVDLDDLRIGAFDESRVREVFDALDFRGLRDRLAALSGMEGASGELLDVDVVSVVAADDLQQRFADRALAIDPVWDGDELAGVVIAEIQLQKADPPAQVIDAFHDVQRARQDQERSVNEAQAYKNDIVPKAKGKAQTMIQAAIAYKVKVTKEAEGEAKRFLSVYETYKNAKDVTIRRLFLERMQEVLKKSEKVIIDKGQGGTGVIPYLALPELRKRQEGASQ